MTDKSRDTLGAPAVIDNSLPTPMGCSVVSYAKMVVVAYIRDFVPETRSFAHDALIKNFNGEKNYITEGTVGIEKELAAFLRIHQNAHSLI